MPFVMKKYSVHTPMKAFLYLMKEHGYSQPLAQSLICRGRLIINGESMVHSGTLIHGEVEIVYFEPKGRGVTPIYETEDFAVFDKPSGVLVHPNKMATEYSLLDDMRTLFGDEANGVHRIDMETSGLLIASKHKQSESALKLIFESRDIQKSYLAWVDGRVESPFEVAEPIRVRDDYTILKHKVEIHPEGKGALTTFVPLVYDNELDTTLLSCHPHTGRTHQIRIHLFHVKHPILGDPLYGTTFDTATRYLEGRLTDEERLTHTGATRLMLHAQSVVFEYKGENNIESRVDFGSMRGEIAPKGVRDFNSIEG